MPKVIIDMVCKPEVLNNEASGPTEISACSWGKINHNMSFWESRVEELCLTRN